jgi:hypothetical protein
MKLARVLERGNNGDNGNNDDGGGDDGDGDGDTVTTASGQGVSHLPFRYVHVSKNTFATPSHSALFVFVVSSSGHLYVCTHYVLGTLLDTCT